MSEIEKAKQNDLGVTFSGSASKGRQITLASDDSLAKIFGTPDKHQADDLMMHCMKVLRADEAGDAGKSNDELHFMVSIIRDLSPKDAVERMLAVQMATTHVATIRAARRLAHSETLNQVSAHYVGFNKLTRTFASQIEALRKYRTGGKQTVLVQHVNVSDGGQAIVGNVTRGGGMDE